MTISFLDKLDRKLFEGKRGDFAPMAGIIAGYSLIISLIAGIIIVVAQFAIDSHETVQTITSIVTLLGLVAVIGLLVSQLLPLFKSSMPTSGKVVYTLFVAVIAIACLLLGILLIYLVVILIAIWVALKIWLFASGANTKSSSSGSKKSSGFRQCDNCLHNRSQDSLIGFCDVKGKNVDAQDYCDNWDHC